MNKLMLRTYNNVKFKLVFFNHIFFFFVNIDYNEKIVIIFS